MCLGRAHRTLWDTSRANGFRGSNGESKFIYFLILIKSILVLIYY
jgi:hypothetical protein